MSNTRDHLRTASKGKKYSEKDNLTYLYKEKNQPPAGSPMRLYYLGDEHPNVYLTLREAQCLYQLMQGHTFASVAEKMKLSPRTVEYYVKNVRSKMRCATKVELVALIMRSDFVNVIGPEVMLEDE